MTSDSTVVPLRQPEETEDPLTAILRSGARRLLAQAVEAEAEAFLAAMKDVRLADGRERVVRHGHGPERLVQTGIGAVPVRRVKLRDRSHGTAAERIRFTSSILPRWARRTPSLDALLPVLYLRGVSMGDFQEALGALLGRDAPNRLDGQGVPNTGIAASSTGAGLGDAGTVVITAGTITIEGGAQIASTTEGAGRGGDVRVNAGLGIRLSGAGTEIATSSTGRGDAGSITISAPRLVLRNGASVSTEARSANGGNIVMSLRDLLYLQRSSITTSVNGALGNGGNITIDPRFIVLDRSVIRANAVGGNGGNVRIRADQLVQSANSEITATSQLGLSGEITISSLPLNLTGSLVVLASELRAAAAVLQESCAAHGADPRSSLVMGGRGGLRHDSEITLPALRFANRPVSTGQYDAPETPTPPRRTSVTLSTQCG